MRQAGKVGQLLFAVVLLAALGLAGCATGKNDGVTARPRKPPSMAQWLENAGSPALTQALTAYESGDYETAHKEFVPLAEAGDPVAQYGLGLLYDRGLVVEKDEIEAARLFRLSAEQGHPAGQNALGMSYDWGTGVKQDYAEAVKWYRLSADQGYAKGQYNLGRNYWDGEGVAQDYTEALRLIRLAADQGYASAQGRMGIAYANGEGIARDYGESVHWYRLAADQGHALSQNNLGRKYWFGQGVEQDREEGLRLFRLAAEQGFAPAQNRMGAAYANDDIVTRDYEESVRWYRLSADQGNARGQVFLGKRFRWGEGVPQDHAEAARLFRLSADQGDEDAQYYLGLSYAEGEGVAQDDAEAARWHRLAADQGHAGAQTYLGFLYGEGRGVRQDDAEAVRLYRLAAEQGHAGGQYHLAWSYDEGRGVEQDYVMAARLYGQSAAQGDSYALNNLGVFYQAGTGVPRDDVAAHALYALAAQRDNEVSIDNQFRLAVDMVLGQIAEAERLAAGWRPVDEVEQSPDFKQGLLWRVESPEGAVSHVFGTMHSANPEVASPPLALRTVLDTADSLSLEIVYDDRNMKRMLQAMLLPDGTRLADVTGQDLFGRLAAVGEAIGIPADGLQKLRPWAVWIMLAQSPDELKLRSEKGARPLTLDHVLQKRARTLGIATYGLETVEEQVALLAGGDEAVHLAMLDAVAERDRSNDLRSETRRLYLAGDLGGLRRKMVAGAQDAPVEMFRNFIRRFIVDRNRTMVDRMAERLRSGNAVIAVGALHLHGDEGIPALLAKQGYKVSRVY